MGSRWTGGGHGGLVGSRWTGGVTVDWWGHGGLVGSRWTGGGHGGLVGSNYNNWMPPLFDGLVVTRYSSLVRRYGFHCPGPLDPIF